MVASAADAIMIVLSLLRVDKEAIVLGHGECVLFRVPSAHRNPL